MPYASPLYLHPVNSFEYKHKQVIFGVVYPIIVENETTSAQQCILYIADILLGQPETSYSKCIPTYNTIRIKASPKICM